MYICCTCVFAVCCILCVHACACLCMKVHLMPSHKIVSPFERVLFLFGCPRGICNSKKIESFSSHIPATNSNEFFYDRQFAVIAHLFLEYSFFSVVSLGNTDLFEIFMHVYIYKIKTGEKDVQKYSERLIYFCHKIIVADVVGSFAPLNMMHLKCAIRQGRYSVAQKIGREESKRPFLQDRGQFVLVNYTSWHVYCVIADVLFPLGLHSRRSIFSPFALLTFFCMALCCWWGLG